VPSNVWNAAAIDRYARSNITIMLSLRLTVSMKRVSKRTSVPLLNWCKAELAKLCEIFGFF
jgi:hypothetical protein